MLHDTDFLTQDANVCISWQQKLLSLSSLPGRHRLVIMDSYGIGTSPLSSRLGWHDVCGVQPKKLNPGAGDEQPLHPGNVSITLTLLRWKL